MSGFDLILTAALCLTCANETSIPLPENLIKFDFEADEVLTKPTNIPLEDVPLSTLETISEKRIKLNALREWINGRNLKIGTLEDYPLSWTETKKDGDKTTYIGRGVSFDLIDFLKEKFNFTYTVYKPPWNVIGSSKDIKESLLEMVMNNQIDLVAAFLPILSEQRQFLSYSTTTLDEGEWIMVMQRPRESASGSGLMAPFDFWVWVLIFVSLLAVGPIIYFLIILRNKLTGDTDQKPYSLGHCAWFVYGALMKQGSTLSPIADSTRLLFATWWIFITILTSFYTANLTAFLTLSKFTLPFNNVNDILVKSKNFVTRQGGGIEYAIKGENESLSMLSKMVDQNLVIFANETNDTVTLQNYVEKNGYVFVRDRPAINHVLYEDYKYRKTINIEDEKIHCPFAKAKDPFLRKKRTFAYPRNTNLSDLFDPELLNLVELGIIKHLSAKDIPNAEICPQDLGGTERQLRNGDLMMTYYIMLAGFATSMAVFTTELIFRYINNRHDNSKWARHGVGRAPNGRAMGSNNWLRSRNSGSHKRLLGTPPTNTTPPPPYQSIFSTSNHNKGISNLYNNLHKWRFGNLAPVEASSKTGGDGVLLGKAGHGFGSSEITNSKKFVNGRDYKMFRSPNGQNQPVPARSPSGALFQYSYVE